MYAKNVSRSIIFMVPRLGLLLFSTRPPQRTRDTVHVSANTTEIVEKLREGAAALVIPAFEYVKQQDGTDQRDFPTDKQVGVFPNYSTPGT